MKAGIRKAREIVTGLPYAGAACAAMTDWRLRQPLGRYATERRVMQRAKVTQRLGIILEC